MKQPVRFEGLGPSGMARRIGEADPERLEVARAVLSEAEDRQGVAPVASSRPEPMAVDLDIPATAAERFERAASAKGGRPAKHSGKPWEAEGISRALWYRRRQAAKP